MYEYKNPEQIRTAHSLNPVWFIIDEDKNNFRGEFRCITTDDSKIPVYVIPTNEELMIALDTYEFKMAK